MANLASVLKQELKRVARREAAGEAKDLQSRSAQHRRDIAELKRQIVTLNRRITFLEKQEKRRIEKQPSSKMAEGSRFSPRWVKRHREKIGFSAADYAKLVGVSALTIYNWEHGKSKPRDKQFAAWVAVRNLKKREALKRLDLLG